MKKIVSLLLCMALLIGMTGAVAEDEVTYTTLYSGEVTTLNYLITASTNEFGLAANLIDTLVEYDNYGQIQPSLADSWTISEDGLTYTFHIREGASWVKADGTYYADVTADDFVAAAKYILDASHASSTADILYGLIAGADLRADERTAKHADWADTLRAQCAHLDRPALRRFLENEVGRVFEHVLADCGVFPRTPEGGAAFRRYLDDLTGNMK